MSPPNHTISIPNIKNLLYTFRIADFDFDKPLSPHH